MKWEYYYQNFYEWADSTQLNRISSLTDFTSTDEIIEIVKNLDEKGASKLIRKALSQSVYFSIDNTLDLCECVSKQTIIDLIKQCKEKFTSEQIEYIADYSLLFEDDILELLNYDIPSLSDIEDDSFDELIIQQPKNNFSLLETITLSCVFADILDKILFGDDD